MGAINFDQPSTGNVTNAQSALEVNNAGSGVAIWGVSKNNDAVVGRSLGGHSGVWGDDDGGGNGVSGSSQTGQGVSGSSSFGIAVLGVSQTNDAVVGRSSSGSHSGVVGNNTSTNALGILAGLEKVSNHSAGVYGESDHAGVYGHATGDAGTGVFGHSAGTTGKGVVGLNSSSGDGVSGSSTSGNGVVGSSDTGIAVFGVSQNNDAVVGRSHGQHSGVWGGNDGPGNGVSGSSASGYGVYGSSQTGQAGYFQGNVTVTGDIYLPGADCAEQFDVGEAEQIEPGTVVVVGHEGVLRRSQNAYDKKVAGVISGAGEYRSGIVLDKQAGADNRLPVALVGKVYCKVDAQYSPIDVGDLLTSSPTPGHAMKAEDPLKAFGAVIGKALRPWRSGCGLIPILIALQ